jgi:hypothetical protein
MKLTYLFLIIIFAPKTSFGQIAKCSIFPEMKSVNPAVITSRKVGQYTAVGNLTKVHKDMDLRIANGSPVDADLATDIELKNTNFFRGGKGKGFTTEFSYDQTRGTKKDILNPLDPEPLVIESKANSSYFNLGMGIGPYFGLATTYVNYDYVIDFSQRFGSTQFNSRSITNFDITSIRPGLSFDLVGFHWGAYYDYIKFSGSVESSFSATGTTTSTNRFTEFPDSKIIGFGLAKSWDKAHIEASHELMPWEKPNLGGTKNPTASRTSGLAEIRIRKLALGYKFNYYKNTFTDLDKIINSQMLFGNLVGASRTENIINFAWGSDKGIAVGGGFSYSRFESKEKPDFINTTDKQNTKTKYTSYSLKLGYSF